MTNPGAWVRTAWNRWRLDRGYVFTCPVCLKGSASTQDAVDGYCGNCHTRTGQCGAGEVIQHATWSAQCTRTGTVPWQIQITGGGQVRTLLCAGHSEELNAAEAAVLAAAGWQRAAARNSTG